MKFIPFGKPNFSKKEVVAVQKVLQSGWIGMGPEVIRFENELAKKLEAKFAVSVNSCSSALFLSLLVLGIKKNDEVICPSLTWCATANAILQVGATPVFCDVSSGTFSQTIESVTAKVTKKTKAVIIVHFGGLVFDVISLRKNLPAHIHIIEDAAHAFGGLYPSGKPIGSSGNLVCLSFYANKNLSTGEGGAILLHSARVATRLSSLRQNAYPANAWKRFTAKKLIITKDLCELGYKMNYTDFQAAVGRVQLKRQKEFAENRKKIANIYSQALSSTKCEPHEGLNSHKHARHLYSILVPAGIDRYSLLRRSRLQGVGVTIHYIPLHTMKLYKHKSPLKITDEISPRLLTLPISSSITKSEAEKAASIFLDELKKLQ